MGGTKLIVVKRSELATLARLREKFADHPDVKVVLERRAEQPGRQPTDEADPKGQPRERRRLQKMSDRDYIVVYTAKDPPASAASQDNDRTASPAEDPTPPAWSLWPEK